VSQKSQFTYSEQRIWPNASVRYSWEKQRITSEHERECPNVRCSFGALKKMRSVYVSVFWKRWDVTNTWRVYKRSVERKFQRVWTTFIYGRRLLNIWKAWATLCMKMHRCLLSV